MHMTDALLSPAVGIAMTAVSAGAIGYSVRKITKSDFGEKKIPMMAVMGAFVFAGQMINFTIPGTGSSGHIGGGILLAAVLGPFPALLTVASVLLIQCLFFADGGLLAYGCNVFNLGICACLLAYQLIYKPIIKKWGTNKKNIIIASIIAVVIGLQAGAFCVVLETTVSGVAKIPFGAFAALMQPIHLAIGIVEGIVTAAVLCFIHGVRPEILETANKSDKSGLSLKKVALIFVILTVIIAGGLSIFASKFPDGLEWSVQKIADSTGSSANTANPPENSNNAGNVNNTAAVKNTKNTDNTSAAGIIGSVITVVLVGGIGFAIRIVKKKNKKSQVT